MNALQLYHWQFSHKETLYQTFFQTHPVLYTKNGHFAVLSPPLVGLWATYAVHLRLIGKLVVDFLLVIIWTSFRYLLSFCHNSRVWRTDGRTDGFTIAKTVLHSMQGGKMMAARRFVLPGNKSLIIVMLIWHIISAVYSKTPTVTLWCESVVFSRLWKCGLYRSC